MNTPRIAFVGGLAGLAAVAILATGNLVRAAQDGENEAVGHQAVHSVSAGADLHPAIGDFVWAYHPSCLFIIVDRALIGSPHSMPKSRKQSESAPLVTDAQAATQAARDQADLDALFAVAERVKPPRVEAAKNAQGERGKRVYLDLCFACHQPDGRGLPGTFPTLVRSDYMAADRTRAIRIVLEGLAGPITVNGEAINSVMPAQKKVLTDEQVADVLTYAFNAWGNPGGEFTASQVAAVRRENALD